MTGRGPESGVSDTAWTWFRAIAYFWIAAAGLMVLICPPRSYEGLSLWLTVAWGVLYVIPGGIAGVATIIRRYVWEWVSVWLIAGGTALYAILSWQTALAPGGLGNTPRACIMTGLVALLLSRAFQLGIDDRRARLAVMARREVHSARMAE